MIRITTSHSAIETEKYFDLALKTPDYYAKEQGIWGGKGAERLGLKGRVERKDFVSLAGNKVPGTQKRLIWSTSDKGSFESLGWVRFYV